MPSLYQSPYFTPETFGTLTKPNGSYWSYKNNSPNDARIPDGRWKDVRIEKNIWYKDIDHGLKEKSEALENLKRYIEVDSKVIGYKVKHYRADGAGELVGRETIEYLESHGISYSWSPHTIQYNTIQYNTIQYNTIQYNTIQYNTIQYNTIQNSNIYGYIN
jgi:hypothetical protein